MNIAQTDRTWVANSVMIITYATCKCLICQINDIDLNNQLINELKLHVPFNCGDAINNVIFQDGA